MESPNQNDDAEAKPIKADDSFADALDDLPSPDGAAEIDQSDRSTSDSTITSCLPEPSPEVSSPPSTLRRRSVSGRGPADPGQSSAESHVIGADDAKTKFREKRNKRSRELKGKEGVSENGERVDSTRVDSAGLATGNGEVEVVEEGKKASGVWTGAENRDADSAGELGGELVSPSWLVFVASLVIKAIGFQFSLFFKFVTFPVWFLYNSYMLVVDPFGVARRCRDCFMRKVASLCKWGLGKVSPFVGDWLKDQKVAWNLLLQCGWGLFWSIYVGTVLCALLLASVMFSGFLMRYLVEQPLQIKEDLNFDYTKNSPVAYVPIRHCGGVGCGMNCEMKVRDGRSGRAWFVPPNHKLQVAISLTLPESGYNRNLGIFQVRVEFLSADGKTLASKSHPCMLKFKSQPVRVLTTLLKAAPLVAGYESESQTLQFNIRGFTEGAVPTSCLKVTIEQRAEFRPGAGIPEIYDASLKLESELPFFKKIIWYWRKTIFVWISILCFLMQLLFTLVCCRGLIIPRTRGRERSPTNNSIHNVVPRRT